MVYCLSKSVLFIVFSLISLSCQSIAQTIKQTEIAKTSASNEVKTDFSQKQEKVEIKVGKFLLILEDCKISYEGGGKSGNFDFKFPGPCWFSKDRTNALRIVKVKNKSVLAVESSKKIENSNDCETQIRGIIIEKNSVKLSKGTQEIAMCLPNVWDEKMFIDFAVKASEF